MPELNADLPITTNPARCLGIDPGLNRTGYAVIERSSAGPALLEGGVIRSQQKLSLAERVLEIGEGIREVVEQYQPAIMAIEQVFSTVQYPKTALLMAHARGAILYAAAERKMRLLSLLLTPAARLRLRTRRFGFPWEVHGYRWLMAVNLRLRRLLRGQLLES